MAAPLVVPLAEVRRADACRVGGKAAALGELLAVPYGKDSVEIGKSMVRFVPEGPQGRPQLHGELFV